MNIDIFTCIGPNSVLYTNALVENLIHKAAPGQNKLRFHGIITHPNETERLDDLSPVLNLYFNPEPPEKAKPSNIHAEALNSIADEVPKDSDMVVVADCDIIMLRENWDESFLMEHARRGVQVFGTAKHDQTLRMFFVSFLPGSIYRRIDPDYSTDGSGWSKLSKEMAPAYMQPPGSRIVKDTGWRMALDIVEAGFSYSTILPDKNGKMYNNMLYHIGGSHKKDFYSDEVWFIYRDLQRDYGILPETIYRKLILKQ